MRRTLLPALIVALVGVTPAPALAQGGATAPDADAPPPAPTGGATYDPTAAAPAKPESRPIKKRSKKKGRQGRPAAKRRLARRKRIRRQRPVSRPRPAPKPSPTAQGHRFPILGAYTFGGEDGRFGSPRKGHSHQGQDLAAADGTPLVAPRTGTVEAVRYQASGGGHYVVLDGDGEDRDYVFMHMRAGSIVVTEGQRVRIGEKLGEVGNTGASFGAHLHFEVWVRGGWYTGGEPIDPLPMLRAWARG